MLHGKNFIQMNNHRYILEPYKSLKSRYVCPNCQKREKTFSLYIDTKTGEHIAPIVGRCNRESNCGYHYTPKQYFEENNITVENKVFVPRNGAIAQPKLKNTSYIDSSIFKKSLQDYEKNNFVQFLNKRFGEVETIKAIEKYFLGTSKHWNGANIFWQIDTKGHIRTGKIMLYSLGTGKRTKNINWVHSLLKIENFELEQCFFGEHLLQDKTKMIAIVESEKTAIICSLYLPDFIWLAVGSLTNLNNAKCEGLRGRKVVLFPDLNGFDKWSLKAKEFGFKVSNLLERKATKDQKREGLDIADFLLNFEIKDFERVTSKKMLPQKWKPIHDWEFSEGSLAVHRIEQERKIKRRELTKEESYEFLQKLTNINHK
jgi:rubredoxin